MATLLTVIALDVYAAEPKRVLLLHAFGHAYAPWSDMAGSFRSNLIRTSPDPIDLFEVSLDSAMGQTPEDERPFVEYIRAILSKRKPDLIVPMGAPAAYFMQRHRSELLPETPMLIIGADARRISNGELTAHDTAVLLDLDLRVYMENILRLLPATTDLAVVVGNSAIERFWAAEFRRVIEPLAARVNITWFNDLTFGEMLERAAGMKPGSAILWCLLSEDAAGVPYSQDRALDEMRKVAAVPLFGVGDYQLGRGIVGGPLMQTQVVGAEAAAIGLRLLRGEAPGSIEPRKIALGRPIFDWRELERWGIREAALPPGSEVQFREPPIWRQYLWQSILVVAALLTQALLIGGLLQQRQRLRRAELDVRHRAAELAAVNRRNLAGELSASIAHEINQPLAAIVSSASAGLRWLGGKTPDIERVTASLKRIVQDGHRAAEIIDTVRAMFKKTGDDKIAIDINATIGDVLDLMRSEFERHGVSVKLVQTQALPQPLADTVQVQQVIVNLIRNAIDAMCAVTSRERTLKVRTEAGEAGEVIVGIEDNGPGIDPSDLPQVFEPFFTTKPEGMGMGLAICRSIIESHGGTLSVSPGRQFGAAFQIVLPTNMSNRP